MEGSKLPAGVIKELPDQLPPAGLPINKTAVLLLHKVVSLPAFATGAEVIFICVADIVVPHSLVTLNCIGCRPSVV